MAYFTHKELNLLISNTNELFGLNPMDTLEPEYMPKKSSIDSILGYSKALSVRSSSYLPSIEMVLN